MPSALLIIDTETTDKFPTSAYPCQVAATLVYEPEPGKYKLKRMLNTMCVPPVPMPKEASDIHGFTEESYKWAVGYKVAVEQLQDVVARVAHQFGEENVIIGGHNHEHYDNALLERIAGENFLSRYMQIDTYSLAMRLAPAGNHKLGLFYAWMTKKAAVDAHDAMADISMVAEIITTYNANSTTDLKVMAQWLMTPQLLQAWPWGKYGGTRPQDVPEGYLNWLKNNNKDGFPRDVDFTFKQCLRSAAGEPWPA